MKILIISPQIPLPLTEGGKRSIFGLMKYLSLRGHNIDFISYLKHNDYASSWKEMSEFCIPYFLNISTDNKISGAVLNLFSSIPYNVSKYHRKEMLIFLKEYFKDNVPDLIQIHNIHMAWLINHLRLFTKSPVVLRQENVEMMIMKRFYKNQKNPLIRFYSYLQFRKFIRYEPKICEKFDKTIFISSEDEKTLIKNNPGIKSITIPSGVESKLLNYVPSTTEKYSLVHLGNLDWLPNADSLQWFIDDILPEVVKQFHNIKLYIYGSGNYNKIHIPENLIGYIIYKGFVSNLWEDIKDKALLVIPLRIGSGIRIKILELLAFGINILSTSIGKEGIELNDAEHILIADGKDQFVSKIIRFFNGDYNNERMIDNGKKFIRQNYLWEDIAYQFEKVYNKLTAQN